MSQLKLTRVSIKRLILVAVAAALLALVLVNGRASAGAERAGAILPPGQVVGSIDGGDAHTCAIRSNRTIACWGRNDIGQATAPVGTFADVSAGASFTCGLRTDGTVACWGRNDVGQATAPAGSFRQLAAGGDHACAVRADSVTVCWGDDTFGQTSLRAGTTFRQVTSGDRHSCGLRGDGLVTCWGDRTQGQADPPTGLFTQLSAGAQHTCGVQADGTAACWGDNTFGQSTPPAATTFRELSSGGNHTCGLTGASTIACWGSNASGESTPPSGTFTAVTSGGSHSCGVRTDGTAVCWGLNTDHQSTAPVGVFNSRAIDTGSFDTCGVRTDGVVACWGNNDFGQATSPPGTFWQISVGAYYNCGIRSDGTLACWGSPQTPAVAITPPPGTFKQVRVAATIGANNHPFACAIRMSGQLACWGDPAGAVSPPANLVTQLAVGQTHACAITVDTNPTGGDITCWGSNVQGESAPPATSTYLQITAEDWASNQFGVRAGTTCAIRTGGAADCWGDNSTNQAVPPAGPYGQIDLGTYFGCGVRVDGTTACWGSGEGLGETTPPTGGFLGITTGEDHACGIRSDGTVVCWGDNTYGELNGAPPRFTSTVPAPDAASDQPYAHTYAASGLDVNSFKVTSGALPPGLTLATFSGVLSGTPTKVGLYTGYVTVSNDFFGPDQRQAFSINVLPSRTVSIGDAEILEGNSGSHLLNLPVTISAPVPSGQTVSVAVATKDGAATAGSDYTAVTSTLTWNPGDPLTKNIAVPILGDTRKEGSESFLVVLSSAVKATIADSSGTATIVDDDGRFHITATDAAVTEGNSGNTLAQFRVTLSAAPAAGQSVSVQVSTADNTASAASDYAAVTSTLTWIPGTPLTQIVKVAVNGDTTLEPTESFLLKLSAATGYTLLSDPTAIGTIVNDD